MSVRSYIYDGGVLTNAVTQQGATVGDLTTRVITAAALVNTTGAAIAATVYLAPAAPAAPGASNALISGRVIAPGETYFCPELINQGVNAGGTIQAVGSGLSFKYAAKDITNG
jgi:hypothetical protein